MHAVKLVQLDNAVGLALPLEALATLRCNAGQTVFVTETAEGLVGSAYPPELQEQLKAGQGFIAHYRDALCMLKE